MPETRVSVLEALEAWALDEDSPKVYWLVGMAGTGKSTISHSLCEILDRRQMLGASFFCSRASDITRDARRIVPEIAYSLAKVSPAFKVEMVKAVEKDSDLAERNELKDQFEKLIRDPVRAVFRNGTKAYKIVVIDALDECTDPRFIRQFIQFILESLSDIPIKIFIASRDDDFIRRAFSAFPAAHFRHELERDVVEGDIRMFLGKSFSDIHQAFDSDSMDSWPPAHEVDQLICDSRSLFIYAVTAVRYDG